MGRPAGLEQRVARDSPELRGHGGEGQPPPAGAEEGPVALHRAPLQEERLRGHGRARQGVQGGAASPAPEDQAEQGRSRLAPAEGREGAEKARGPEGEAACRGEEEGGGGQEEGGGGQEGRGGGQEEKGRGGRCQGRGEEGGGQAGGGGEEGR